MKRQHEFRDPVHQFVEVDSYERAVIDSPPVQRLRDIHQLALSFLVYPGATHKRFEHSLGVMELAGQVFDVITAPGNITDAIREQVPELNEPDNLKYWRQVVRYAALCHDLGHIPFSHAAEGAMLQGKSHEDLSHSVITSENMSDTWASCVPPVAPHVVAKIALGQKELPDDRFSLWENILSEIIVGDAFGVDRIDYLLRDSLHAGVAYGKFDYHRLISTLRILPPPRQGTADDTNDGAPMIGIEQGGIHAAEALGLARYFMFTQVYFHPVRIMYDVHLVDFLKEWLSDGLYPIEVDSHLNMTDSRVLVAMFDAASEATSRGHDPAERIVHRNHFKVLYERSIGDIRISLEPTEAVYRWAQNRFDPSLVRHVRRVKDGGNIDFPVKERGGYIASAQAKSEPLANIPIAAYDAVFIDDSIKLEALTELRKSKVDIIQNWGTSQEEETP